MAKIGDPAFQGDDTEARRGLVRDITERQARVNDDPGFLYDVAKIGILALGGALLGRKVMSRDWAVQAADRLGRVGRTVTEPVSGFVRGFMDELAGVVRPQSGYIRTFDLMEQVAESLAVSRQAAAAGKTPAEIQALIQASRQGLRERGFEDLNRAGLSRFRPATVGDVMASNELQAAIGPRGFEVIREGLGADIIGHQTALTRGFGGIGQLLVRTGERTPTQFVDTRWTSPRNVLSSAYNLARNVRVPFTGFRPADLIAAVLRPFGEGHFAGQVGRDLELSKGVTTGGGLNFVVGGRLLTENPYGMFEVAASNLRLARIGRVGQAHMERMGASQGFVAKDLQARIDQGGRGGFKGFLDWVQHKTGIGWEFRTRDSALETLVLDPLKRRNGGVVRARPYVEQKLNLSFLERYRVTAEAELRGIDPETLLNEAALNRRTSGQLSFFDKVKAHYDIRGRAVVVKPGSSLPYTEDDLPVKGVEYIGKLGGRRQAVPGHDPLHATLFGELPNPHTVANEFYAYRGKGGGLTRNPLEWVKGQAEAAIDLLHYGTNRLNDLFGATARVGFRPSVGKGIGGGLLGVGKNLAKTYGLFYGFQAGVEYANYADYLFESTVGTLLPRGWDSPKKLAIRAYQGVQLARHGIRDVTMVSAAQRYSEDLMPGSMDSGLSFLARTVLPAAWGAAKSGIPGLKVGLGVAALIGGSDPGQSTSEALAEFTGDKQVAVRKSRWWMLGRQPFEGGQIDHFEPHWTVRELSDFRYTGVQYGSKGEYFRNVSRIPTPSNLFGMVPLFQEGGFFDGGDRYLARKHQYDRPYPDTPGIDADEAAAMASYLSTRGPYDAPMGAGQRLGYGTAGSMPKPVRSQHGMLGAIEAAGAELSELAGVYKFAFWDLPGFSKGQAPKLASYSTIGSKSREFWDANLGGGLGMTELYRRFVSPDEAKQGVNPIPNLMPTWLPGSRSDYPQDRQFHIDFSLGDPYAKMSHGEFRLPGEGYERMYRLHSGTPGVYDAMDRFLILADVAPESYAYDQYKVIVEGWAKSGVLDASWAEKVKIAQSQVSKRMERYQFYDRRFTGLITDPHPDVTADKYNLIEKAVGAGWEVFSHDVVPKIGDVVPIAGTILSDKLLPTYSPVEHFKRFQVYGEEFGDWRNPWKSLLRPRIDTLVADDPLTATAGGAAFGLFGANPMAAMALSILGGAAIGAGSTARSIGTHQLSGGWVPQHRQNQWELEEYFDNLQYAKGKMLEQRADAVGDREMASYYNNMWQRTTASINYQTDQRSFMRQAIRGLSREERGYFKAFSQMPTDAQDDVMPYLPPQMQPSLIKASGRMNDDRFNRFRAYMNAQPDTRVASYFSQVGMPDAEWGGWHPDVPMDAIKIKMVDAGANSTSADIHKFSLYDEHVYRASKFDGLEAPSFGSLSVNRQDMSGPSLAAVLSDAGFENVSVRTMYGPNRDRVHWNVQRSNWDNVKQTLDMMFR